MKRASPLPGIVLVVVVLAAHLALFPKIADLDGFYHLGHAAAYAEGSIFDTSFPWASQSVMADRDADLWWGFHVALLPFAVLGDIEWGVRVAALVLTFVLLGTFHVILRRHGVRDAAWWTVALFLAVPNVLFRFVMLRPHMLSLAGALMLLSVLVRGRWWQAFAISAAIAWMHLSLAWVAPAIAMAYGLVRAVERAVGESAAKTSVPPLAALGATVSGVVVGWLLRPNPVDALSLAGVQIIRVLAEKATEEPLTFSVELAPLPLPELMRTSWLYLLVWLCASAAAVAGIARGKIDGPSGQRTLAVTALLVSSAFLVITLVSARRAMEQWVAFGVLALPFLRGVVQPLSRRRAVRGLAVAILAGHIGWGSWRHSLNVELVASPPDTMAGVADYLAANSQPGDVVFHAKWDNFGPLFARNRTNLYLSGMDPIFQLAHDPRLYWEFFYLSSDLTVEWTCDAFPCANGGATDTHEVLTDHFGARWVVVEPRRNPRFTLYLLNDARYRLASETPREAVFEVLRVAEPPPA